MSLVAYASSDESDSDVEPLDNRQTLSSETELTVATTCSNNIDESESSLAPRMNDNVSDSDSDENEHAIEEGRIDEKLSALPHPKTDPGNSLDENDVLEEEVKPKTSQIKDAPKPPSKKVRQPVKFTIAAKSEDSDEDEPASKKAKTTNSIQGKSGLFSLLPPPVHAAKKEANRILLPHSLTKKTPEATKQITNTASFSSSKAKSVKQKLAGLTGYGSDSDEDVPTSFFSLDSSEKSEEKVLPEPPPDLRKNRLNLPPPTKIGVTEPFLSESDMSIKSSSSSDSQSNFQNSLPCGLQSENIQNDNNYHVKEPVFSSSENLPLNDEPLKFNAQHMGVSPQFSYSNTSHHRPCSSQSTFSNYGPVYHNKAEEELPQVAEASNVEGFDIPEQELLRLQGKKKRGKEEIHFVDVNADDYTDPSEIHKHLSEEQTHQSHRKKDGPTSTQKRKHQITYLAHQAKERELELKNQWSQNRMTRKQTQAKYGF